MNRLLTKLFSKQFTDAAGDASGIIPVPFSASLEVILELRHKPTRYALSRVAALPGCPAFKPLISKHRGWQIPFKKGWRWIAYNEKSIRAALKSRREVRQNNPTRQKTRQRKKR